MSRINRLFQEKEFPPIDKEKYPKVKGLEGPDRYPTGKVLYYDKFEGKYYDIDKDDFLDTKAAMKATGVGLPKKV